VFAVVRHSAWSSPFHRASFVKLHALAAIQFRRIVVLDTDTLVLRNIDHLLTASHRALPTPAFAFRFKCWSAVPRPKPPAQGTIWEMNSGVMVLKPDALLYRKLLTLLNQGRGGVAAAPSGANATSSSPVASTSSTSTTSTVRMTIASSANPNATSRVGGAREDLGDRKRGGDSPAVAKLFVAHDPGEQSVWRRIYSRVHELPVAYNTFRKTWLMVDAEWDEVYILHDSDVHRSFPLRPRIERIYSNLTTMAKQQVAAMAAALGVNDRGRRRQ